MTTATVLSGGPNGETMTQNGTQYWAWEFTVNVDGQVYVVGIWVSAAHGGDNPAAYQDIADHVQELLESDDPDEGLGGISQADSDDDSVVAVGEDDDDGALASNGDLWGDSA